MPKRFRNLFFYHSINYHNIIFYAIKTSNLGKFKNIKIKNIVSKVSEK